MLVGSVSWSLTSLGEDIFPPTDAGAFPSGDSSAACIHGEHLSHPIQGHRGNARRTWYQSQLLLLPLNRVQQSLYVAAQMLIAKVPPPPPSSHTVGMRHTTPNSPAWQSLQSDTPAPGGYMSGTADHPSISPSADDTIHSCPAMSALHIRSRGGDGEKLTRLSSG